MSAATVAEPVGGFVSQILGGFVPQIRGVAVNCTLVTPCMVNFADVLLETRRSCGPSAVTRAASISRDTPRETVVNYAPVLDRCFRWNCMQSNSIRREPLWSLTDMIFKSGEFVA
jgi:hypothetical protein